MRAAASLERDTLAGWNGYADSWAPRSFAARIGYRERRAFRRDACNRGHAPGHSRTV